MVKEGAYRKAIVTLSDKTSHMSADEDRKWAAELHPRSLNPAEALSGNDEARNASAQDPDPVDEDYVHPLKGVHFAALKAPGPSGLRPEHLSELLGVPRRRVANRLLKALGKLIDLIGKGRLSNDARWITRSRTIFIPKKSGKAPRPLKVGEVLRSSNAKRLLKQNMPKIRSTFIQKRQWGIAVPGGAEALIHWRGLVDEGARTGLVSGLVVADLDMENFFNSVEWKAIRASIDAHLPEIRDTVAWEQAEPGTTVLNDGTDILFDRGAEQGETLGPTKAAMPLGDARDRVETRLPATVHACDNWFIDDGVLVCRPEDFDSWLRAFDDEVHKIGVTRGSGPDVKSAAKLVCAPGEENRYIGLDTPYVRDTCKVLQPNCASEYLGAIVGDRNDAAHSVRATFGKVASKRHAISSLNHPAAELVLNRRCADVSNITYWMRCYGDLVPQDVYMEFDMHLRRALEHSLRGDLQDASWWQATLSVGKAGGLGFRTACDSCLPAFIGSRVSSRPLVSSMLAKFESADLGDAFALLAVYDARTDAAVDAFLDSLPEGASATARLAIQEGLLAAGRSWERMQGGTMTRDAGLNAEDDTEPLDSPLRQMSSRAAGLVLDAGAEDEEHPFAGQYRGPRLQRTLSRIVDEVAAQGVRNQYEEAGSNFDVARLDDLGHAETDHSWLWGLCAQHGAIVDDNEEYVEAVRVRLGCGGPAEGTLCSLCGDRVLDRSGAHASCCAVGESTRGHNAARDVVHKFALYGDPSAECEPQHLIPSRPRDRPADVLTSAAPGCVAALDVGVASPAALAAGDDAAEAMWRRKVAEREPVRGELEQAGIIYKPFVFTTFGRPHPAASETIRHIAKRGARQRGWAATALERQFRSSLGAVLARRMARMSLATWAYGSSAIVVSLGDFFPADLEGR